MSEGLGRKDPNKLMRIKIALNRHVTSNCEFGIKYLLGKRCFSFSIRNSRKQPKSMLKYYTAFKNF